MKEALQQMTGIGADEVNPKDARWLRMYTDYEHGEQKSTFVVSHLPPRHPTRAQPVLPS